MVALPFAARLPQQNNFNFWIVFLLLIIFGAFSGTAQGAVFTMAAGLPFKYMGAVMLGSGICGIGPNLLRGVTLLVYPIEVGSPDI